VYNRRGSEFQTEADIFAEKWWEGETMKKILTVMFWALLSILGAVSVAYIAFNHGEKINALWFVTATACFFTVSYRFYSKWLAAKVLTLDEERATPALVRHDGRDFVPTNRWIVFGHHFAAIAGAGPLAGPVLASQFGYLPGTLWILIGATLGGAVHDAVTLFCSIRRGGKSLGQMVKDEVGTFAGQVSLISILCIMVILIAVLSLIVVKALAHSPWGLFTIAMTIPIALIMGCYLRLIRPGKVAEISIIGVVLLLLSVWGGKYVHMSPFWSGLFTRSEPWLAGAIIVYGLAASILPVWLLLAPRDYLSSFMKIGTVVGLMIAILWAAPSINMPKLTQFIHGNGPVVAGKLFPFLFITIACSAISGFHALISSGTTPKLVTSESSVRFVGYGAMITEMAVGMMALIAATVLEPGQYFAINTSGTPAAVVQKVNAAGFPVTEQEMQQLADDIGEKTMFSRAGGAPTFAVGMAHVFTAAIGSKKLMGLWYHFAIMFEALFILTTVDAGTRVGRFLLQDMLGHVWKPLGNTGGYLSNIVTSVAFVSAWGWFLYQGVVDPRGGINTLWPVFGIANQLLAVISLALGTTILIKMGRVRYMWVTFVPMCFLLVVTMTAGWQKILYADAAGFAPAISGMREQMMAPGADVAKLSTLIFNNQVDIVVTVAFMALVCLIVLANIWTWARLLTGRTTIPLHEDPKIMTSDPGIQAALRAEHSH
jgi:carbon starvation protein